jgi:hypothetical protein
VLVKRAAAETLPLLWPHRATAADRLMFALFVTLDPMVPTAMGNGRKLVWILATAPISTLAFMSFNHLEIATRASTDSSPYGTWNTAFFFIALSMVLVVPLFETLRSRHNLVTLFVALSGLVVGGLGELASMGHGRLALWLGLVVLAPIVGCATFLAQGAYVGLLPRPECIRWYLLWCLGAMVASWMVPAVTTLGMALGTFAGLLDSSLGSQSVTLGIMLIVFAGLLALSLPGFGDRDAPLPGKAYRQAFLFAIEDFTQLPRRWPILFVLVILPLPASLADHLLLPFLYQSQYTNIQLGMWYGVLGSFGHLGGLLLAWLLLYKRNPERLVVVAALVALLGMANRSVLVLLPHPAPSVVGVLITLNYATSGFVGTLVLLLAMCVFGSARSYLTLYTAAIAAVSLRSTLSGVLVGNVGLLLGTVPVVMGATLLAFVIAVVAFRLWRSELVIGTRS